MKKSKKLCDITVIIITYNEDNHLKSCIDSLKKYVQNVFILDSYSTDKTVLDRIIVGRTSLEKITQMFGGKIISVDCSIKKE